jgi:pimeloyl-ACP methyl ester carboxylesterase
MIAMAAATPASTAIEASKAMRDRPDRTHILKHTACPVLFIAGREDQAVPLISLQEQFYLPSTTVTIQMLPDTGHMGMIEKKFESSNMLRSWVQQVLGNK